MFDGRLLATERSQASKPKHTGAKVGLSRRVIEKQPRLARHSADIKRVVHQKEHIHVVRFGLRGNERSEDNEASKRAANATSWRFI